MDLVSAIAIGFAGVAQLFGQAGGEDLGAAARHRLKSSGLQARQRLRRLDLPAPPEVVDLGRGESLDLHARSRGVKTRDDPLVVLERPVRMVTADDVDFADLFAAPAGHAVR